MTDQIHLFPLKNVTNVDLQNLSQCLWRWQLCGDCSGEPVCAKATCHWSRAKRQQATWTRYKDLTAAYVPELFTRQAALNTHADLLKIMRLINERPDDAREHLVQRHFVCPEIDTENIPAVSDQYRAMDLAASILFSVNCGMSREHADLLEDGISTLQWRNNLSATEFLREAFPKTLQQAFESEKEHPEWSTITPDLSAKQLRKLTGLQMEPTCDLRSHLVLDHEKRVVRVFHCTAMLKENLSASRSDSNDCVLPRQLILEVLHTINNVLFPSDRESQALLSSLVSKHGFDEDLLRYESMVLGHEDSVESTYAYFGVRLAELYDELQNPSPRTRLESWFERKSGARYMLMATMIGVFIAIVIGILGLGVSTFQAWVSYQQWKHPIKEE